MSRRDDLTAAIAKQKSAIGRLKSVKKRDAGQTEALLTNYGSLVRYQDELLTLAAEPAPTSTDGLTQGDPGDTTVSIDGGSPGNPNGVTFTIGDAIRWWGEVFKGRVNYAGVRPTLLPGGHVLTDAGREAAAAIVADPSSTVAPSDWNPLGLPVIP